VCRAMNGQGKPYLLGIEPHVRQYTGSVIVLIVGLGFLENVVLEKFMHFLELRCMRCVCVCVCVCVRACVRARVCTHAWIRNKKATPCECS
jgi:hypothetical protein